MGLFLRAQDTAVTASAAVMRRAAPAPYGAHRAITASAAKVQLSALSANRAYQAWQSEAWTGYERIGEIHYGIGQIANILSRLRIYAAAITDSDSAPMIARDAAEKDLVDRALALDATEAVAELTATDFSTMLYTFALNFRVPGECYLIKLPDIMPKPEPGTVASPQEQTYSWVIRSCDEVKVTGTGYELIPLRGSTSDHRVLDKDTFVGRMWQPNARYSSEPDSSMAAIADPIEELLLLSRLVRSSARSRLNAGMLFMPDGITVANSTAVPDPITGAINHGDEFISQLLDSMVTPVTDEGNASAVVPMVVTGPSDLGALIKHITFERASDEWLVKRAERALDRILNGLDFPKEIVTGLGEVKFSNALVIDESLFKGNIEPLALAFVDSLTQVYLRPVLRALGKYSESDLDRICIWYDPSEIVTRPNASADADKGYELGLLSADAWRREHGFADTDAPSEDDLALVLLKAQVLPPEVVQSLLQTVLPKLLGEKREAALSNSVVPFPKSARDILQPAGTDNPAPQQVPDGASAPPLQTGTNA